MFNWDDLKPLLAVARHGSTTAAARSLRVDQSTVQRRIAALEARIGQPLVERHASGYRLTAYGETLLPLAESVEREMGLLEQRIRESAREFGGVVRLTCPEPLVERIVQSQVLQRLEAAHPRLSVEFVTSDRYLDLWKGEADVALRSGDTDDGGLVGRKVADSLWAVYASHSHLERAGSPSSLAEAALHSWVALDATLAEHRLARWMRETLPGARIVATSTSVLGLLHSATAGVGIAALPTALGDAQPSLVRLLGPIPELTRVWRLLTTPSLRRTGRIDAFFRFVVSEKEAFRTILTG